MTAHQRDRSLPEPAWLGIAQYNRSNAKCRPLTRSAFTVQWRDVAAVNSLGDPLVDLLMDSLPYAAPLEYAAQID